MRNQAAKRTKEKRKRCAYIEPLEARIAPASFTVTNLHDSGTGSLRQAINDANYAGGADMIDFRHGLHGTIKLRDDLPVITDSVTISGPGTSKLTVDAQRHHLIDITGTALDITISGLKLTHGEAGDGGGVFVDDAGGSVTLLKTVVSGNKAVGMNVISNYVPGDGGGVKVAAGHVTIEKSKITGNQAGRNFTIYTNGVYSTVFVTNGTGGGLGVGAQGTVDLKGTTIQGNLAANGGGIHNAGALTIEKNSLIAKNTARSLFAQATATGGGILNDTGGTLDIKASKVTGNRALGASGSAGYGTYAPTIGGTASGGGIFNASGATLSITQQSKITGNKAIGGKGGLGVTGETGEAAGSPYLHLATDNHGIGNAHGNAGGRGGSGGLGASGGSATGGGIANAGTLTIVDSKITGNAAVGGSGGKGGKGGWGGQGSASVPGGTDYYGHHTPGIPAGRGGPGGFGGAGGGGGIGADGGVYDSTGLAGITNSTISGNIQKAGKTGSKGARGAHGPVGSVGGTPYYGAPT